MLSGLCVFISQVYLFLFGFILQEDFSMKATWPPAALGSHSSTLAIFSVGEVFSVGEIFSVNSRGKVMGRTMLGVMYPFLNQLLW